MRANGSLVVPAAYNHRSESVPGQLGAILPRIVAAGTVTRRAVEATWLTGKESNTFYIYNAFAPLPEYNF